MKALCGYSSQDKSLPTEERLLERAANLFNILPARFGSKQYSESDDTEGEEEEFSSGDDLEVQGLSQHHIAFLCNHVRNALVKFEICIEEKDGSRRLQIPMALENEGVVLFADISGFTGYGERLKKFHTAKTAADNLSTDINAALKVLTQICLKWGGDVVKFAGDAIICVWRKESSLKQSIFESSFFVRYDTKEVLERIARRAALEMLHAINSFGNQGKVLS